MDNIRVYTGAPGKTAVRLLDTHICNSLGTGALLQRMLLIGYKIKLKFICLFQSIADCVKTSVSGSFCGNCFSVKAGVNPPPSLQNIFKELNADLGISIPNNGELTDWAKQGVLMMNTVLTVRQGQPNSHKGKGWEQLTDAVIKKLNERNVPTAFILWGGNAKAKAPLITNPIHAVFKAAHPSPLSAYNGFFGCRHFSKVNDFLVSNNIQPIDWTISNK